MTDDEQAKASPPSGVDDERFRSRALGGAGGQLHDCVNNTQRGVPDTRDSAFQEEIMRLFEIDPSVVNDNMFVARTEQQSKFAEMQRADQRLRPYFIKANAGKSGFVMRNGILYKTKPKHIRSENSLLLVVPDACKAQVLQKSSR